MTVAEPFAAPVAARERIAELDVLRGFALLGILLMNVQSFAMLSAAYFNPVASQYFEGIDRVIWVVVHVLADQKFMTLFSVLFGAGIVLMTERAEAKRASPAALHYRRTFWLLVIGAAHAYLLWYGDVLVWYGLSALVVFWFRRWPPRRLLAAGLVAIAVGSLLSLAGGLSLPQMPPDAQAQMMEEWAPSPQTVTDEIETYRGGWLDQMAHRVPMAVTMHTFVYLVFALWRAGGLMLVGMALYKWGVLSGTRSDAFYRRLAIAGVVGLAVVAQGVATNFSAGWTLEYSRFLGFQYNYWGSLAVSAGYLGLVVLWCRGGGIAWLRSALAAVGRTAFTNYILQTVICTWIYYGHGLGRFMDAGRVEQMIVVLAVWAFQLAVSPWWLARFRFGPLEWLWRGLTYGRLQPMRVGG